jgi:acetyl esterase/lipase
MKRLFWPARLLTFSLCLAPLCAQAVALKDGQVLQVWPDAVPGQSAQDGPDLIKDEKGGSHIYHVHRPVLSVALPAPGTANGAAVIACPGGGYVRLPVASAHGSEAQWLKSLGVTTFVLTYRLGNSGLYAPLQDVTQAIRIVRSRAAEFGLDPRRIGVFGSSAGGHLAAWASTAYDEPAAKTGSPLDTVSARPDFAILEYPVITMQVPYAHGGSRRALIGGHPTPEQIQATSVELHVTAQTPPTFVLSTEADKSVPQENAMMYYEALLRAHVSAELHLYELGPHGFGFRKGLGTTSLWPELAAAWMRSHAWIK